MQPAPAQIDSRGLSGDPTAAGEPSLAPDPLVGVVLDGRFVLEARIGQGGFGVVYRARQTNVGRSVAVKLLSAEASLRPENERRIENEARIISHLRHPNTLKLIDFGRAPDGRLYIVTEYLSGASLDQILAAGPVPPARLLTILASICDALTEAHGLGIVHRDLKPRNVILERVAQQDVVKVLDFGVATLAADGSKSAQGRVFGTPAYMSPEQARGDTVDPRSDLYSLGVLAYECLTGGRPFAAESTAELLRAHLTQPPVRPSEREGPAFGDTLFDGIILQLLAKHPDDRPASAAEVRGALTELERKRQIRDGLSHERARGDSMTTSGGTTPVSGVPTETMSVADDMAALPAGEVSMEVLPARRAVGPALAALLLASAAAVYASMPSDAPPPAVSLRDLTVVTASGTPAAPRNAEARPAPPPRSAEPTPPVAFGERPSPVTESADRAPASPPAPTPRKRTARAAAAGSRPASDAVPATRPTLAALPASAPGSESRSVRRVPGFFDVRSTP